MKKLLIFLSFLLSGITGIAQHVILTPTPQGYWNLNGNVTGASNWLGSSNNQPLIFKTNNTERFRIGSAGTFSFNTYSVNFGTGGTVLYTTGASSLYVPYTGATGSVNLGANSFSVGGTSTLSSTNVNGTLSVGSPTAIGTSSLVQMYVTKGTATVGVGALSNSISAIWVHSVTPSTNNYWIAAGTQTVTYNAPTNGTHQFYLNDATELLTMNVNSNKFQKPLRVGSATVPSATLDVTGTMSVSSTATITGAAKQTNTLNYEGNTTWNTNQTNTLTTGNSGTIAVLSDAVFAVQLNATTSPIADGATNYFGNIGSPLSSVATMGTIRLPYNCTLVAWQLNSTATATASTESTTLSIRANDATDTQLSTAITFSATQNVQESNGLSISFTAGDKINAKCLFPTFATNPTAYIGLTLFFVRRQ